MNAYAPSTTMNTLGTREDLCSPRPNDRAVVKALRKMWCRIGEAVKAERPEYRESPAANVGLFILGYGKVPGTQKSGRGSF